MDNRDRKSFHRRDYRLDRSPRFGGRNVGQLQTELEDRMRTIPPPRQSEHRKEREQHCKCYTYRPEMYHGGRLHENRVQQSDTRGYSAHRAARNVRTCLHERETTPDHQRIGGEIQFRVSVIRIVYCEFVYIIIPYYPFKYFFMKQSIRIIVIGSVFLLCGVSFFGFISLDQNGVSSGFWNIHSLPKIHAEDDENENEHE